MTTLHALSALLVALAIVDWWCTLIIVRLRARHPDLELVRSELQRRVIASVAATCVGILGFNFLIGSPLPRGTGFVLLSVALVLLSGPTIHLLINYYRGKL